MDNGGNIDCSGFYSAVGKIYIRGQVVKKILLVILLVILQTNSFARSCQSNYNGSNGYTCGLATEISKTSDGCKADIRDTPYDEYSHINWSGNIASECNWSCLLTH